LRANQLVGDEYVKTEQVAKEVLNGRKKQGNIPKKWVSKFAEKTLKLYHLNYYNLTS
jgi:hypothetical protein